MNFLKNKINKYVFLLGIVIIVIVFIASFVSKVKTTTATGLLPFGGMVTELYYCSCSANWAVTVGSPKGGVFSYYNEGTITYANGMPHTSAWAMGTYGTGGVCLIPGEPCPAGRTPIGIMTQVGTSLTL